MVLVQSYEELNIGDIVNIEPIGDKSPYPGRIKKDINYEVDCIDVHGNMVIVVLFNPDIIGTHRNNFSERRGTWGIRYNYYDWILQIGLCSNCINGCKVRDVEECDFFMEKEQ